MRFIAGTPAGIISDSREVIEIKLWEAYLLNTRSNLPYLLNQFSIDHGPVENLQREPGRIVYRFMAENWENDIKPVLYDQRVPVVVRPSSVRLNLEASAVLA